MNIIIDSDKVEQLREKFIVLELDTIRLVPSNRLVTAYAVMEHLPIDQMSRVESMQKLHQNLIIEYKKKNWNYCLQAIEHLINFWNGELTSFYEEISGRIAKYIEQDPGKDWDATIEKTVTTE